MPDYLHCGTDALLDPPHVCGGEWRLYIRDDSALRHLRDQVIPQHFAVCQHRPLGSVKRSAVASRCALSCREHRIDDLLSSAVPDRVDLDSESVQMGVFDLRRQLFVAVKQYARLGRAVVWLTKRSGFCSQGTVAENLDSVVA